MYEAKRFIISGEREVGKTALLLQLKDQAKQAGFNVSGVISPAVFRENKKIGIDLLDLRSEKQMRLADLNDSEPDSDIPTIHWTFNKMSLQYGNVVLGRSTPCDLLIVDELGPIELERKQGWQNGIFAIESQAYQTAVIVIRPSLLVIALQKWPDATVLKLEQKDTALQETILHLILKSLH